MVQAIKKNKVVSVKKTKVKKVVDRRIPPKPKSTSIHKRKHKEYGTSNLERKFAKEFLDTLCVEYIYQFKAESIGRYFDFYLPRVNLIIEVDGDYW